MEDRDVKAWFQEQRAKKVVQRLERRGFLAAYAADGAEAQKEILAQIPPEGSIAITGSQTMEQLGVYKAVRGSARTLVDPYAPGLTPEQAMAARKAVAGADIMLSGSNAIDEDGRLYNIDGLGNRVAAMIFGPEKVILAISLDKLAAGPQEAWQRARQTAAPMNNKRLARPNPCVNTGSCHDCQTPSRICNYFSVIERSNPVARISVVLVGESFGY